MTESTSAVAGAAGRVGRDIEDDVIGMGRIAIEQAGGTGNNRAQVIQAQ